MKIYIDGDGCPVIDNTIKIAKQYNLECIIITDTAHIFNKFDVKIVTVSKGADSVDFAEEKIEKSGITKRFENINLDECVNEIINYLSENN